MIVIRPISSKLSTELASVLTSKRFDIHSVVIIGESHDFDMHTASNLYIVFGYGFFFSYSDTNCEYIATGTS